MTGLPDPTPIREFNGVDRHRFESEIRPLQQPAIMRGLVAAWPAVKAAAQSPEAVGAYFRSFGTSRPVGAIIGEPEIKGRFFYSDDMAALNFQRGTCDFGDFLGRLLRDQHDPTPFSMAVQSEKITGFLPGFVENNHLDLLDRRIEPRLWIGNRIRVAPHYDLVENIGCVVAGRRRFTLFPPEQIVNLYPGPLELTPAGTPISMVDLANPDLGRYPRFADAAATAQRATLEPGDAIYIPYHWWHGVDSLDPVSAFVNYWWNDNIPPGIGGPYDALMHGLFALRPLPDDQRAVWKALFDYYIFSDQDPGAHLPPHARGVLGRPPRRCCKGCVEC